MLRACAKVRTSCSAPTPWVAFPRNRARALESLNVGAGQMVEKLLNHHRERTREEGESQCVSSFFAELSARGVVRWIVVASRSASDSRQIRLPFLVGKLWRVTS